MSSLTEYVFHFEHGGKVARIPFDKWKRIRDSEEAVEAYSNQAIYIAYVYILLENRKPVYCPRIDGAIYYFNKAGNIISDKPHCIDIFEDIEEETSRVINLQYRKKKKEVLNKYYWRLNAQQIQQIVSEIW